MPWLIELVQKYNGGTPRYLGGEEVGLLTATPRRAAQYSSGEGAAAAAAKLVPHPWGKYEAREVITGEQA